ncbi:Ethylmalonyl-CoA/methylmalonyl-CoA epimerase [subsurface metagenome]
MIVKIDHIGVAVSSIDDAVKLYRDGLGLKTGEIETVEAERVKVAMIAVGESRIELLEPTGSEGAIAKYIEKRGEGVHHLALKVSDIRGMLEKLKEMGIPLIDEKPRIGAGGTKMAFIHPKGAKVLMELVEY